MNDVNREPPWLWLASQSPRRQEILQRMGVRFERLLPDPDEDVESLEAPRPKEPPSAYVLRVTHAKAEAAEARRRHRGLPAAPILAADTTVAIGRDLLGKPSDAKDAEKMLKRLSDRSHKVFTAVVIQHGDQIRKAVSESRVTFNALSDNAIARYIQSGEPFGKAGAYAIQGQAEMFVRRIVGSPSGIVGLPMAETARLLRHFSWDLP